MKYFEYEQKTCEKTNFNKTSGSTEIMIETEKCILEKIG